MEDNKLPTFEEVDIDLEDEELPEYKEMKEYLLSLNVNFFALPDDVLRKVFADQYATDPDLESIKYWTVDEMLDFIIAGYECNPAAATEDLEWYAKNVLKVIN